CCSEAEDPCLKDIGILSSLDPVALDKACLDLIYNSNDPGKNHFIERVESRNGIHLIETAVKKQMGSLEYELIEIDKN
ncbi:MAG: ferredoxin, partial [Bacilli bacterium]